MLDSLLGFVAFCLLHSVPILAGYRLCCHFWGRTDLATLASGALLIWAGLLTGGFRLLASMGIATLPWMLGLVLTFGVVVWSRTNPQPRHERRRLLAFWQRMLRTGWPVALIIGAVLFCVWTRGVVMPPLAWDSLSYHLVSAAHYVQTGSLEPFFAPDGMDGYSHFTENGEILAACFLLPFRSDTLLGLMGWPVLLILACSLFAIARRFQVRRRVALWLSLLVALSPMCLAYLNSAYVDLPVAAETLAGVLFCLRFVARRRALDAVLVAIAFGLAVGTKPSSIPVAGIAGLLVLVTSLRHLAPRWSAPLLAGCLVLGLGLATPKYIANAMETGNPFYPIGLQVFGHELPHSLYVQKVFDEKRASQPTFFDGGFTRDLVANLLPNLEFATNIGQIRTAGPVFGVFLGLALVFLLTLPMRGPPRLPRILLATFFVVPLVMFYADSSDSMKLVRRMWAPDCSRFLTAPLALCAVAGISLMPKSRQFGNVLATLMAAACLWQLCYARISMPLRLPSLTVGGAGLALLLATAVGALLAGRKRYVVVACGIALLGAWTVALQGFRDDNRYLFYAHGEDLHPFPRGELPIGWSSLDEPKHPHNIAFATGWGYHGHNWLMYPLFGRRLQNKVVYASVNRPGRYPTSLDRGLLRETSDRSIWMQNLAADQVDYVFIQEPAPAIELPWLQEQPEFKRIQRAAGYWIFARH